MWASWVLESPVGSADSEEGPGKAGSGQRCGPVPTEMLCAWQMLSLLAWRARY